MRAFALILLCSVYSTNAMAKDAAGLFDTPVKTVKVPLPADHQNPQAQPTVSCFYFKPFAVKQIDRGEVGAELSIVPVAAGAGEYKCREATAPGEIALDAKEWSGYYKGVKGGHLFLDAADGQNGGLGLAIFDARNSKKLFDDTLKNLRAV